MKREIHKIALINPDNPLYKVNPGLSEMFSGNTSFLKQWAAPALSLLTIASLTPSDIEVEYIDERYENIDFERGYDLVGITSMTHQVTRAYEIASQFRKKNTTVVMGGIHVSILPDEALQYADTIFVGEAEKLWPQYLDDFVHGTEKRLYRNEEIVDLSISPVPRYDLIKYPLFKNNSQYFNFIPVQATRGCPHDCNFCVATKYYGSKIRKKSVDQVVREIEYLKANTSDSLILFADDNLFVDKKYAKALLRALISLRMKFLAQTDVQFASDKELMELSYAAGFEMVFIGFESISIRSLELVNSNKWKMSQVKNYSEIIKRIQENGIVPFGGFIIGFDHDNINTFTNIRDFVIKNNFPAAFTLLTPLPGSRIREEMIKTGRMHDDRNWEKYGFYTLLFHHPDLHAKDAENALIRLYKEVFTPENSLLRAISMKNVYKRLPGRWVIKE